MVQAEHRVLLPHPVDRVFSYLLDGLNNPKWRGPGIKVSLKSGQAGHIGAVYTQTMPGPGGQSIPADYQLTEIEPQRKIAFAVIAGPARPKGEYHLLPVPEGTELIFRLFWEPRGFKERFIAPMVARQMPHEVNAIDNLKNILL